MVKKSNQYTLKEAIDEMMKSFRLQGKVNEMKLLESWEKVMGPAISKYTRDIKISNRVLYVELTSAALRQELSYGKTKMIAMLNEEAGSSVIDDIVLR
jgi:predicted nucleic acid-binding Zn ribbon protein